MKFTLFTRAALARDVPKHHLKKGDVVRIIDYLDNPETGYALEVFDALGNTLAVFAVPENYVEAIQEGELLQVRHMDVELQ